MVAPVREIVITQAALTPPAVRFTAISGAVVDFYGVVRGQEGADAISGIDYEAHVEMARRQLESVVLETCARFDVHDLIVHHRVGFVPTALPSLFLRVSAAHRGPAFEAGQWLIEQLKARVPIWKHPVSQASGAEVAACGAAAV